MADETATVARFAAQWVDEDAPAQVRRRVRSLLLDAIGSAIRARAEAESTPSIIAAARVGLWHRYRSCVCGFRWVCAGVGGIGQWRVDPQSRF